MTEIKKIRSLQINDFIYSLASNSDYVSKVITSPIPLSDPNLILADGRAISEDDSTYGSFVSKVASQVGTNPLVQSTAMADWTQPILSSDGTVGGNSFAVQASSEYLGYDARAYRAFDGNTGGTEFQFNNDPPCWVTFYNPLPLNVTRIICSTDPYWWYIGAYTVQASNDNTNWTNLVSGNGSSTTDIDLSSNKGLYKYYRIYITSKSGGSSSHCVTIQEIRITAKVADSALAITQGKYVYNETSHELTIPSYDNTTEYHYVIAN